MQKSTVVRSTYTTIWKAFDWPHLYFCFSTTIRPNTVKAYLDSGILSVMDRSPQNLDFNIFEAVEDRLDREQNRKQQTSKEELCTNSVFALYTVISCMFVHFDKLLHLFPIVPVNYKEIKAGARL